MNKRILIFGKGYFGKRLQEGLNCPITGKRIRCIRDAQKEIDKYRPRIIINCIGHIGRNVDDCEINPDETLFANSFVPVILAEVAIRNKLKMVHLSTGCIYHFDYKKNKPIKEQDAPDFFDLFYSRTKIYAERALEILSRQFNILIVRPRVPLDDSPHPKNLLTKLLSFKAVINLPNSVTYIPDFIAAIKHLIKIDASGIYNVVNKGALRYPAILEVYKKYSPHLQYKVIDFKKLKLKRTNIILSTDKLQGSGFKVRDINKVLKECVENYLK
ncbi:MAG: sugar nucleotide-binding protein [Candidatus Omnitrophica bacterium]|nr:sugar nucleotide-binding protein [Candidatus Omnitrophota bacterium]